MLKKRMIIFLSIVTILLVTACTQSQIVENEDTGASTMSSNGSMDSGNSINTDGEGIKKVAVTTSFLYDMVKQIAEDYVEVSLIIPAGEDPHLYLAKPEDYTKLDEADLVLYHGLHFEGKMVEALEQLGTAVSDGFPEDRIGMMEQDGENIIDPHFWFDIELYKLAAENAAKALIELNPENTDTYEENLENYLMQLDELDAYVKSRVESIPKESRYLITPHDAFNYFAKNYDIVVKAPQGVSTESEVSNKDIQSTVDFIVEHKIKAVFAESTTDPARMEKLRQGVAAKGLEIKVVSGEGHELFSDSLAPEGEEGDNFIDMYKHNVDLIVENLK